ARRKIRSCRNVWPRRKVIQRLLRSSASTAMSEPRRSPFKRRRTEKSTCPWIENLLAKEELKNVPVPRVHVKGEDHQGQDNKQPQIHEGSLDLLRGRFTADPLIAQEGHVTAVQEGDRQEIDDREADADEAEEEQEPEKPFTRNLVANGGNPNRSAEF